MAWAFVMLASACWMGTAGSRVTWPDASAPVPVTGAGALQGLLEVSEVQRPLVAIVDVSPDSLILAQDVWNDPQLDSLEIDLLVSVVGDRGGAVRVRSAAAVRVLLSRLRQLPPAGSSSSVLTGMLRCLDSSSVPPGGAIFVITSQPPSDVPIGPAVAANLDAASVKFYVLWGGGNRGREIYQNLAESSRGAVIDIPTNSRLHRTVVYGTHTPLFNTLNSTMKSITGDQLEIAELGLPSDSENLHAAKLHSIKQFLSIELDGSNLYALPGETKQILLRLKNLGNRFLQTYLNIGANQYLLVDYYTQHTLEPLEQRIVPVRLRIPPTVPLGTSCLISINVRTNNGLERLLTLNFYVGNKVIDGEQPTINHKKYGYCRNALTSSTCYSKNWRVDIFVQDKYSGVLKISTQPIELIETNRYIIGTKEPINFQISVSCCIPKLDIIAQDLGNNVRKHTIDVEDNDDIALENGEIAAIVLGAIIIIIVIIVIIAIIVKCRKRKSLDFPSTPR